MSTHFYPLVVKKIAHETKDAVSIEFDVPEKLADIFQFTQGQYLTLRTQIQGQDVRRSYSLCSSPLDRQWRVAVKQIAGGAFSTFAKTQLQVGDTLDVMPPMGKFYTPLHPQNQNHYVFFAAGSGITPVLSIIRTVLQAEPSSVCTLFYGNRSFDTILFLSELEGLKNKHLGRLSINYVLSKETPSSPLFHGRINGAKTKEYCTKLFDYKEVAAFFLCGPEEMIFDVKDALTELGVAPDKVHFELFTTPNQPKYKAQAPPQPVATIDSHITIILDGDRYQFPLTSDGASVLDTAHKNGADLPYACKGGVCCTCRAKVLEGEVFMDINYSLEPDEVEAGFVLTCQAHPKTSKVVISFDEK